MSNPYVSKPKMEQAFLRLLNERNRWRREVRLMRVLSLLAVAGFAALWWVR